MAVGADDVSSTSRKGPIGRKQTVPCPVLRVRSHRDDSGSSSCICQQQERRVPSPLLHYHHQVERGDQQTLLPHEQQLQGSHQEEEDAERGRCPPHSRLWSLLPALTPICPKDCSPPRQTDGRRHCGSWSPLAVAIHSLCTTSLSLISSLCPPTSRSALRRRRSSGMGGAVPSLAIGLCLIICVGLILVSLPMISCLAAKSSTAQKAALVASSSISSSLTNSMNANHNKVDVCHNFTVGDRNKGEFYSPRYPNDYPNNTECVAVLQAPFGSFIRVEFRDQFSLEESDTCEYDRLEIRNGQFGYSDLLDVYCGHSFPQEISSSDNYLWMRFKSDESIEYSGFRAVYHFIPLPTTRPEPPSCYFEKSGASGYIRSTEIPESVFQYYHMFKVPIECIWNITVQSDWHMYVNFDEYELSRPNDCDVNYIDIYESVLSEEKRKERFCGTATEPQKSDGNIINIRFHVQENILKTGVKPKFKFKILFTAFRTDDRLKCNPRTEFDCDDGTCIAASLKCNSENNCKYRYDEDPNTTCFEGGKGVLILTSDNMIAILAIFALLVVGMCTSIFVSCWGKIQERRQRELDYKLRRSRETSVECGLDRPMTVHSLDKNMMALVSGSGIIGNTMSGMGGGSVEYGSQSHHPLLSQSSGRSHTPILPPVMHHSSHTLPAQHHRSHSKLASASVGSSGDPVLIREEDEEDGDMDEEDIMRGSESCYVCNENELMLQQQQQQQQHRLQQQQPPSHHSSLHHLHGGSASSSTSAQQQHMTGTVGQESGRVLHKQQPLEVDEEEDEDQYSSDTTTPPQIISVNCPLYHQHQQHHSSQQLQQQPPPPHQQSAHHQQQHLQQAPPHHKSHVSIHTSSQQNIYQRDRSDSDDLIPPPPPPPALSHLRGRVNVS